MPQQRIIIYYTKDSFYEELRGRVNKQVRNGSETAVLDVMGFLCVSLVCSTFHFHDSLGSRRSCACSEAGLSSQNGNRA
jgi:hypothetical protein